MQPASVLRMPASLNGKIGLKPGFQGLFSGIREKSPGWISKTATSGMRKVYVSDAGANAVYIYNAASPTSPIGTITNGISEPLGSAVDAQGNLYVANLGANTVTVYPAGQTDPSTTYSTGLSGPIGVAVGADGTLYVSEFQANAVVEYDSGQTSPSRTLAVNQAEGVALDAKNNLFVSYNDANTGEGAVQKFAPKATTGRNLGITVAFAGDLKINKNNDLLLEDQIAGTVNFYKPQFNTPYGAISVGGDTYKLALGPVGYYLYVATFASDVPIYHARTNGMAAGSISGLEEAAGVSLSP